MVCVFVSADLTVSTLAKSAVAVLSHPWISRFLDQSVSLRHEALARLDERRVAIGLWCRHCI